MGQLKTATLVCSMISFALSICLVFIKSFVYCTVLCTTLLNDKESATSSMRQPGLPIIYWYLLVVNLLSLFTECFLCCKTKGTVVLFETVFWILNLLQPANLIGLIWLVVDLRSNQLSQQQSSIS